MTSDRPAPSDRPAAGSGAGVVEVPVRFGLDLAAAGRPEPVIEDGPEIRHVALCGTDHVGLKPRMKVREGDLVRAGQALFTDKRDPAIRFTAPGAGEVVAVHRGERRVLESVVIRLEDADPPTVSFGDGPADLEDLDRADVVERLSVSGLWTALRSRPFGHVPLTSSRTDAIFVTAIDTAPLAADPLHVIRSEAGAFEAGLRVLSKLTEGTVWLCTAPGWDLGEPTVPRLRRAVFDGPHPAGAPGTHIHALAPVSERRAAWHVGYADVIAIGRLFADGVLDFTRVVALGGEPATRPRLVRTRLGASLAELVAGEVPDDPCRVVSGSPLSGRAMTAGRSFLGRYHVQVSLVAATAPTRRFGWLWGWPRRRVPKSFTTVHIGRGSGMLPLERFERLLPPGFVAVPLLRALMAGDVDGARELGCLELEEEDLALCAWACPARCDYGGALRSALDRIEREG